ncbi:hypothetical protein KAI92_04125 [Candidatus Parcubacteria bacterium]|nr:hypothetical protein [Candidatus Parcubacteria bacterium]
MNAIFDKNEALYLEYLWYFNKISEMIEKEKPKKISPTWFSKKDRAFLLMMIKNFVGSRKEMWLFISKKLEIQDIFAIQKKKNRTFDNSIKELEDYLNKEQPDKFSPKWISYKDDNLYKYICSNIKDNNGLPDWNKIIYSLDEKWMKRFVCRRIERRTIEDCIANIEAIAREKKVAVITPKWIFINLRQEYCFILSKLSKKDNMKNWNSFLKKCPDFIRDIWHNNANRLLTERTSINVLKNLLEEKNPENFSRRWIELCDMGLYRYLIRHFKDSDDRIDWADIIMRLPKKWQEKWSDYIELELLFMKYFKSYYEIFQEPITIQNKKLNEIFVELVQFFKKGNIFAKERIFSMLAPCIIDWFIGNDFFYCFKINKTKLDREIINFINNYDELKGVFLPNFKEHLEYVAKNSR